MLKQVKFDIAKLEAAYRGDGHPKLDHCDIPGEPVEIIECLPIPEQPRS